jgi:RNA polymerase sigma factor (TIGR02999 family)
MTSEPAAETLQDADGRVTVLLRGLQEGGTEGASELMPLIYQELRRLAAWKMAREPAGQTLQPTALVHEAWLRLVSSEHQNWQNRRHFLGAAAEAMRRILVENARRKRQAKRGGTWQRIELAGLDLPQVTPEDKDLLVNEALEEFTRLAPIEAEVVKLHYYVGLSHAETAQLLGLSERTVKRHWAFARVWLYRYLKKAHA